VPDPVVRATILIGRSAPLTWLQFVTVPRNISRNCAAVRLKTLACLFTTTANKITATGWPTSVG
jgi:hypothetical protein